MDNPDALATALPDIVPDGAPIPTLEPPDHETEPEKRPMQKPQPVRMYGKDGKLSRDGMREAIRNGGSVSVTRNLVDDYGEVRHPHQIIWRAQDLPDDLELAGDDPAKKAEAIAKMERQQADLQRRLAVAKAEKVAKLTKKA